MAIFLSQPVAPLIFLTKGFWCEVTCVGCHSWQQPTETHWTLPFLDPLHLLRLPKRSASHSLLLSLQCQYPKMLHPSNTVIQKGNHLRILCRCFCFLDTITQFARHHRSYLKHYLTNACTKQKKSAEWQDGLISIKLNVH